MAGAGCCKWSFYSPTFPSLPFFQKQNPIGELLPADKFGADIFLCLGGGNRAQVWSTRETQAPGQSDCFSDGYPLGPGRQTFPHRTWLESSEKTPSLGVAGFIIGNTDAQVCWQPLLPLHRNFVENEATQGGSGFKRQRGSFLGSLHVPLKPRHPRTSLIQKTYVTLNRASVHCS